MGSSQLNVLSQSESIGEFHQEDIGGLLFSEHIVQVVPHLKVTVLHTGIPGLGPYQVCGGSGHELPPDYQV